MGSTSPLRVIKYLHKHTFETVEPYYAEADCSPSITTFLNETCCLKDGGCHPARITVKLPESVTEYVIAASLARSSDNPGTDCRVTSFCIHDGDGNGYEYAIVESDNELIFWRESGWDRYDEVKTTANLPSKYDEWHILVARRRDDGYHVVEVRTTSGKLLQKMTLTNTYYSGPFTHLSFCGGRPYYIDWVALIPKYYEDVVPRPKV